MNGLLRLALAACVLALPACSEKKIDCPKEDLLGQFRGMDEARVVRFADNAFDDGDKRILAVRSVGLLVPSYKYNPDLYRFGIRVIGGTSDTPCNKDEANHNAHAAKYAEIYNKEMLKRVALDDKGATGPI